ncbi:hypothetical protein PC119_g7455 [Phytophthora cactorum]|uniref:Uncharacterized protein n=1 Tax=Phytophthora cactorum TaxID=29920 RepID=A0A8T1DKX4_9STRA|nr:hypothetical protein PC115_g1726 [Phytophthora cactorum]KAG3027269.1 hypothetical protein PC119_g7455 [Phytophthora cactorum]
MANRKITRCRGARGQLALYNPHTVPIEVAQELEGIYGLRPKEAAGCLADVMISQRKGEFPPVAFMLIHKDAPGFSLESTIDRKGRPLLTGEAEKAFENAFAIAVLPIPRFTELQLLAISNTMQIKIFTAFSLSSGAKLMVSVHEKLASQITEKADQLNKRMNDELLTRKHAMDTLQTNFPFLTVDECDMLLDLFGSIASIAQAGAEKLLDVTVLSTSAAQAIEEFFKSEYVVE